MKRVVCNQEKIEYLTDNDTPTTCDFCGSSDITVSDA